MNYELIYNFKSWTQLFLEERLKMIEAEIKYITLCKKDLSWSPELDQLFNGLSEKFRIKYIFE